MYEDSDFVVVAIVTWIYAASVPMHIELLALPVAGASSRGVEDSENGVLVIDEDLPIPDTEDGRVYYIGATSGGEFMSIADAIAWADK
jgi:hypothetical protein